MTTIAPSLERSQAALVSAEPGAWVSSYGGLLLLAKAWAALGGSELLSDGIHWRGKAGGLLLFVLVALPALLVRSVLGVARDCREAKDPLMGALGWGTVVTQRRLDRFVTSPRHDWMRLLGVMLRVRLDHGGWGSSRESLLVVDSTTVEKRYGPKMAEIRPVYDSAQDRLVDGYEVVSACVAGEQGTIPIGLVPHRKAATAPEREAQKRRRRKAKEGELPSKLDLALALVSLAVAAGVGATTVVGDSAFAVMWWLREVAALGRQWLVTTRQDRRLRIGAEIGAFRDWAKAASVTFVESGEKGSTLYGTLLPKAVLLDRHCQRKGLDCRPAYFERRNKAGKVIHRWYMVTSQWDWDLEAIWLHWSWRWQIEELHRDSKHSLLLSSFHVRTWEGIVALIACTCLRVNLVYFLRAVEPACGALSVEGLVPALSKAACHVQPQPSQSQWKVTLPPTLPATVLWQEDRLPLPQQYWPIVTKVA